MPMAICCNRPALPGMDICAKHDPRKKHLAVVKKLQNELEAMHDATLKMEATHAQAKKFLEQRMAEYAELHYEGAKVAASKGDTRPAEWALTHVKSEGKTVVDPPAKAAPDSGVRIMIGIGMGGVPQNVTDAEIISLAEHAQDPSEDNNE